MPQDIQVVMRQLKTDLITALVDELKRRYPRQVMAAKTLELSTPRVSNLYRLQIEKFSVDCLLELLSKVGYEIDISIKLGPARCPHGRVAAQAYCEHAHQEIEQTACD